MTIVDILEQYNVPYRTEGHEHCRPGWCQVDCPNCSHDWQHFRMGINLQYNYATCWTCGPHKIGGVLVELTKEPWWKIKELLSKLDTVFVKETVIQGSLKMPDGVGLFLNPHRKYLQERGFDPDELTRLWSIKGIGLTARLAWRLFIPIIHRGKMVSWTTRSLVNKGKRYINASPSEEIIRAKDLLYGIDYVRHAVIVTEGPFDAMRIGPGAIATMGLMYTRAQVSALSKIPIRCVCFDNEPEAQRRAERLCHDLVVFPGVTTRVQIDAPDPGSASEREVRLLRKEFLE